MPLRLLSNVGTILIILTLLVTACKSKSINIEYSKLIIHLEKDVAPQTIERAYKKLDLKYEVKVSKSQFKYRFRVENHIPMEDILNEIKRHPKVISIELMKTVTPTVNSSKNGNSAKVKLGKN